jgi:alpha-1,2-glucosyltransferase
MLDLTRLLDPAPSNAASTNGSSRSSRAATVLVLIVALAVYLVIRERGLYSDEVYHYPSVVSVAEGEYQVHPALTTIPGYHYLCGIVSRLVGDTSPRFVRSLSVVFGLGAVWAAARLTRSMLPEAGRFAVAQAFFLPLALPYYALMYTDILSLFVVLTGLWLWFSGRQWAAALALTSSMTVRQTNVIWLLFIVGYAALSDERFEYSAAHLVRLTRRTLPALVGIALFALFVWLNGGVAMGSMDEHVVRRAVGNVYFCLFVYFFLFLPTNLFVLWKNRREMIDPRLWALLVAAYALYRSGYRLDSPYNFIPGFLRNEILMYFDRDETLRNAFFFPVALTLAALFHTPLRTRGSYALYPLTILLLLPTELIEHRYYIIPMTLVTLLRLHENDVVEGITAVGCAALSAYFVVGIGATQLLL